MNWKEIVLVSIAGLLVVLVAGFKEVIIAYFKQWTYSINAGKQRYLDGIRKIAKFHESLERLAKLDCVDRVLIFSGTNGGGTPDPKTKYTINCFYGWSNNKEIRPEQKFNFNMEVDSSYMKMLVFIAERGFVEVHTDQLEDGQLRDNCILEGVKYARVYRLYLDDNLLIFISLASFSREFNMDEKARINFEVDRIRSIMYTR